MMQTLVYNNGATSGGTNNTNGVLNKDNNSLSFSSTSTTSSSSTLSATQNLNTRSDFDKLVSKLRNDPAYKKEIITDKIVGFYKICSELGNGNFSQVKIGLHLLTRDKVAIKILNKTKLDEKTQRLLLREITSMQDLHHPNIIRLYEVIHTPTRLYICMEYAPDGELYTRINEGGKLKESEGKFIFSQIISAVHHMHSINIIHRDIKAENIFLSNKNPVQVKIGDFGFSIQASVDKLLNTYCGSPPYAAPELFRDDNYTGIYVDIWALGVLLYFIVSGIMPFKAETVSKLKRAILSGEYFIPAYLSDSCQLLIRGILKPVPSDRFTIREIMDSAWLDGEKFASELEPYQLHIQSGSTYVRNELKEEIYTKKVLEKFGITSDYLLFCNIKETNGYSIPNYYGTSYSNTNIYMRNLTTFTPDSPFSALTLQSMLGKNPSLQLISHDIKHAINGTYRIVFHKLQKRIRNELNSEDIMINNSRRMSNHSNNGFNPPNLDSLVIGTSAPYSKDSHSIQNNYSNGNGKYYDNDEDDDDDDDDSNNFSINSNQSAQKQQLQQRNSIFVRVNNPHINKIGQQPYTYNNVAMNNNFNNKNLRKLSDVAENSRDLLKTNLHQLNKTSVKQNGKTYNGNNRTVISSSRGNVRPNHNLNKQSTTCTIL